MMAHRLLTAVAACVAAIALAGCVHKSTHIQGTPPSTLTPGTTAAAASAAPTAGQAVNYGAEYLAIVNPINGAASTAKNALGALPATTTASAYVAAVAPYLAATQAAVPKLLAVHWPGQAEGDVRTLTADIGALDGDMSAFATMDALNYSTVTGQYNQDASKMLTAAETVRADLGLPTKAG